MLGSIRKLLGRSASETVWYCEADASPRMSTDNERQFDGARVFCCIRTDMRSGAEHGVEQLVNENGWKLVGAPRCQAVRAATLPKPLQDLHRAALREGEAIKFVPQPKAQATRQA